MNDLQLHCIFTVSNDLLINRKCIIVIFIIAAYSKQQFFEADTVRAGLTFKPS